MSDRDSSSTEHLENAREIIWEAIQMLEQAQRVLFKAGDCYVAQVWGDGVRAVIDVSERITDLCGELTASHIEIGRMAKRDQGRDPQPPG